MEKSRPFWPYELCGSMVIDQGFLVGSIGGLLFWIGGIWNAQGPVSSKLIYFNFFWPTTMFWIYPRLDLGNFLLCLSCSLLLEFCTSIALVFTSCKVILAAINCEFSFVSVSSVLAVRLETKENDYLSSNVVNELLILCSRFQPIPLVPSFYVSSTKT